MKQLESSQPLDVVGGAMASPYPVPGATPPYVPIVPQAPGTDVVVEPPPMTRTA